MSRKNENGTDFLNCQVDTVIELVKEPIVDNIGVENVLYFLFLSDKIFS